LLGPLGWLITALDKDDTELFKQFFQNESFRRFVTDMVKVAIEAQPLPSKTAN
jgi:hypothetical protein